MIAELTKMLIDDFACLEFICSVIAPDCERALFKVILGGEVVCIRFVRYYSKLAIYGLSGGYHRDYDIRNLPVLMKNLHYLARIKGNKFADTQEQRLKIKEMI
jgi:hypothetical protein